MLRNRLVALLCRFAGHPTDVLICPSHRTGIVIATACVCGAKYREVI